MTQMPKAPKFNLAMLGPGVVLIAMGLGSGEFILWPYLAAQFGFGVLWGALVGVTLQYFVSNESGRYTLATGDSVFAGFARLGKFWPYWFIASTFLSFAWPGIVGSGGQILGHLFNVSDYKWLTIAALFLIALALTFGGKVYTNLKRTQRLFVLITTPTLIIFAALLLNPQIVADVSVGLIGMGNGYFMFPPELAIGTFLGAIAFAGAGGNLILSHSFYVQDEGLGMAKGKNTQIEAGSNSTFEAKGEFFTQDTSGKSQFYEWFDNLAHAQFITFWGIGIISIILLTIIAYALSYPFDGAEGISFVFVQADELIARFGNVAGTIFLTIGAIYLFTTQLGVYESTSRIMSENLLLASPRARAFGKSRLFFAFLWAQTLFAIAIAYLDLAAPLQVLFINTFFSAISMFVVSGALWKLNTAKFFPEGIRTPAFRQLMLIISFIFFGIFVGVTIWEQLF